MRKEEKDRHHLSVLWKVKDSCKGGANLSLKIFRKKEVGPEDTSKSPQTMKKWGSWLKKTSLGEEGFPRAKSAPQVWRRRKNLRN